MEFQEYLQGLTLLSDILEGKIYQYPTLEEEIQKWKRKDIKQMHEMAVFAVFENCYGYAPRVLKHFLTVLDVGIPDLKRVDLKDEDLSKDYSFYFICLCLLDFQHPKQKQTQKRLGEKLYRAIYSTTPDISEIETPEVTWKYNLEVWKCRIKEIYKNKKYLPFLSHVWLPNKENDFKDKFLTLGKRGFSIDCDEKYNRLTIQISNEEGNIGYIYSSGLLMMPVQLYLFSIGAEFKEQLQQKKEYMFIVNFFRNCGIPISTKIEIEDKSPGVWIIKDQDSSKNYKVEVYDDTQLVVYDTIPMDQFCQDSIIALKSRLAHLSPLDIVFYFNDPKMEGINSILSYCLFGLGVYGMGAYERMDNQKVVQTICETMEKKLEKKQLHCFYQTLGKPVSRKDQIFFLHGLAEFESFQLKRKIQTVFDATEDQLDTAKLYSSDITTYPHSTYIRSVRFILPQEKIISNIYQNSLMLTQPAYSSDFWGYKLALASFIILFLWVIWLFFPFHPKASSEKTGPDLTGKIATLEKENVLLQQEQKNYEQILQFSQDIKKYLNNETSNIPMASKTTIKKCLPGIEACFIDCMNTNNPIPLNRMEKIVNEFLPILPGEERPLLTSTQNCLQAEKDFLEFVRFYQSAVLKGTAASDVFQKFGILLQQHEKSFYKGGDHQSRRFYHAWRDAYNFYQSGRFALFPVVEDPMLNGRLQLQMVKNTLEMQLQDKKGLTDRQSLDILNQLGQIVTNQSNQIEARKLLDIALRFKIMLSYKSEEYTGEQQVQFSIFTATPLLLIHITLDKELSHRDMKLKYIPITILFVPVDNQNQIVPFPYFPKADSARWYKE